MFAMFGLLRSAPLVGVALKYVVVGGARQMTVDGDRGLFPSAVAYYDKSHAERRPLWWDMNSMFTWLRERGMTSASRDFFKRFAYIVDSADDVGQAYQYTTADSDSTRIAPICTTSGLACFLSRQPVLSKSSRFGHACATWLTSSALRVCSHLDRGTATITYNINGVDKVMRIHSDGHVTGFIAVLLAAPHGNSVNSLSVGWAAMHGAGALDAQLDAPRHSVVDLLKFLCTWERWKRVNNSHHSIPRCTRDWLGVLQSGLIRWLSNAIEQYTLAVYVNFHDVDRPPPSVRASRADGRPYVFVQPSVIWDMIMKSSSSPLKLNNVIAARSDDSAAGGSERSAERWENVVTAMYQNRLQLAWPRINHVNMAVDGSTHNYNEVLVGLAFSWELGQACYCTSQTLVVGKEISMDEDDLDDTVANMRRRERLSAYRNLQGISHMVALLNDRTLADFELPDAHLLSVGEHEKRVVRDEDGLQVAYVVDTVARTCKRVLPRGLNDAPLLVLQLDQGSINGAATGFLEHKSKLVFMKWEKVHRVIRDLKGPLSKCCGGTLLKTQVWTSYLWNLGTKPFGSGFWGTVLQRAVQLFSSTVTIDSPIFQKYVKAIGDEFNMPYTTQIECQEILNRVSTLRSFTHRLDRSKMGRWFSWNAAAWSNLNEFMAQKCVLEHYLSGPGSDIADPDHAAIAFDNLRAAANARTPQQELEKLRSTGEGLKLAYRMMSTSMRDTARIIQAATKSCWDWYTDQVTTVVTPAHQLAYNINMADGWATQRHVQATFAYCLSTQSIVARCCPTAMLTSRLCELSWSICSERMWTFASRHSVPPDNYAPVLGLCDERKQDAVSRMRDDATDMHWLDRLRHSNADAATLWRDCHPAHNPPIRLLMALFERDSYSADSVSGRKYLRGCVETLADNKGTEELHHHARLDAKRRANKKQPIHHIQNVLLFSKVLESRRINHAAMVTRDVFFAEV